MFIYLREIVGYRKTEIWKTIDWFTIIFYLLMIVAGWFTICGASFEFDSMSLFDINGVAADVGGRFDGGYFCHTDVGKRFL